MSRRDDRGRSATEHPSAWKADIPRMRTRMAALLAGEGAIHADVAAAALAARGAMGLDRPCFALLFGVDEPAVAALEAGKLSWADAPLPLRQLMSGGEVP